ncbi:MAG: chemotaxis response regulator protein-glutamate methylesterase [Paracoccus sp. (in: a-proteobacteria)]|uniref:protein-glutamate methylesterase/protein-glutamine glutaminase n=1 Tax=Paracoccus sp. TaxID=267 RepID=UPI0026E02E5B|nr:chemotaxis response regulator protein-glutamate methylesterase [Paracoccus sp. (in: a-proteobacteria)]MDO5622596.1 chemotaxis response regulator protein-glutamate methylesterase [Paracoccus sp. (in: a-proteobacteria)]
MNQINVLVVDDSPTMRRLLRLALQKEPRLVVVGEAGNADEARRQIAVLRPDVLTLDVEMPGESGLDFLRWLMAERPMPVVMCSTETQRGSSAAVEALSLGAVDCIGKPVNPAATDAFDRLPAVLMAAAAVRFPARRSLSAPPVQRSSAGFNWNRKVVLIGSSTGGVEALERVLQVFPENGPPVLITQHMPESFLASFAQRLNTRIAPNVALARDGARLEQGRILLAPGGASHLTLDGGLRPVCRLIEGPKRNSHRPSVDELFDSAVFLGKGAVAVMLTGMGRDGAEGMLALRRAGARCIAQDQDSSVVWGMPRVAHEMGAVEELLPLGEIGTRILELTSRPAARVGFARGA